MAFLESSSYFHRAAIVGSNGMNLWCETFGEPHHPATLLVGGAGAQCIMWPEDFCEFIAKKYFVIRYDHRDTGLSTRVNYQENPYTLMDLTRDALGILDYYHIDKAHIVGLSMGGQVAQFIGAYFPERAKTLALIATSTDFKPLLNLIIDQSSTTTLTAPTELYSKVRQQYIQKFGEASQEERQELVKTFWRVLNGNGISFDEPYYTQKAKQFFARHRDATPTVNHASAMKEEETLTAHSEAPERIKTPTLIMQGRADPIFGLDHGEALHHAIVGSKFVIVPMGHLIPSDSYQGIAQQMLSFMAEHEG